MQFVNAVKLVHCFLRQRNEKRLETFTLANAIEESNNFMQKHKKPTANLTPDISQAILMHSQKVKKACHFERQREILFRNNLILLRFLPMVEMTL